MSEVRSEQNFQLGSTATELRAAPDEGRSRRAQITEFLPYLAVPLVSFILIVGMGTAFRVFQYDTDEGLNLMKAALLARGYSLYSQIWSDQPPVHTYLLAGLFRLTGASAQVARVLTAGFSALLIVSLYDVVRRTSTKRAALLASALLLASAWYLKLSFSVMIGLPSLALAVTSLALLVRAAQRPGRRLLARALLCISAVLMAAAIGTKVSAGLAVLAGVALLWMLLAQAGATRRAIVGSVLVWLVAILVCCIAMTWAFHLPSTLVETHLVASGQRTRLSTINAQKLLRRDSDLLLLALIAPFLLIFSDRLRRRGAIIPLLWFFCSAVVLQFHEPVWYHHSLLLSVPATWIAALVIEHLQEFRARRAPPSPHRFNRRTMAGALLAALIVWQAVKFGMGLHRMVVPTSRQDLRLVEDMRRRAPQTKWVVADRLMYPFAAGLIVPPELAVVSTKRRETGNLPDELMVRVLQEYRPEQILLARIEFGRIVMNEVDEHYRLIRQTNSDPPARLYLRKNLLPPATSVTSRPEGLPDDTHDNSQDRAGTDQHLSSPAAAGAGD